jgi:hypothetical protein
LGSEHPDVGASYNNIGNVYTNKGDNDKALEYYKKDLDISLKSLGSEHPLTKQTQSYIDICKRKM